MDSKLKRNLFLFVLSLSAVVLFAFVYLYQASVEVEIEVSERTYFQIYWAERGQPYAEDRMEGVFVHPNQAKYKFLLTNIGKITRLRLDPIKYSGDCSIRSIRIHQVGYEPIVLKLQEHFAKLNPLTNIGSTSFDKNGLRITSTGVDPNLEFLVTTTLAKVNYLGICIQLASVFLLVWIVALLSIKILIHFRFVPVYLFGALILVISMGVLTKENVHPDEYVHLVATEYYETNWFPPKIADPEIRDTYSVYGVSRLNNRELYYFVAGKVYNTLSTLQLDRIHTKRLVNILMFVALVLIVARSRDARVVAIPFLISPQVWYVFSYCDSDSFALFLCFIVSCELCCRKSIFSRYLKSQSALRLTFSAIYLGLLLGCTLLSKKNYYPYIAFAGIFCFIHFYMPADRPIRKQLIKRIGTIILLGACVFGTRIVVDLSINGLDRKVKLLEIRKQTAEYLYNPSTPPNERITSMSLRERGVSLSTIIKEHHWLQQTFRSAFGMYGYFTVIGSNKYYKAMGIAGGFLGLFFFGSLLFRGGNTTFVTFVFLACSAGLVGLSLYSSWTNDLQPQGRYLFAIVPMVGLLYGNARKAVNRSVMMVGVTAMYFLGVYSFITYGLVQLPKTVL